MINNPPPFKGLNIGIPIIMPIKGRGSINKGSGLSVSVYFVGLSKEFPYSPYTNPPRFP